MKIKEIRKLRRITAKSVAEHLGVSYSTYMRYESGQIVMTMEQLVEVADFLKCSMDDLVARETEPEYAYDAVDASKSKIDYFYAGLNDDGRAKAAELVELVFMNPAYRAG